MFDIVIDCAQSLFAIQSLWCTACEYILTNYNTIPSHIVMRVTNSIISLSSYLGMMNSPQFLISVVSKILIKIHSKIHLNVWQINTVSSGLILWLEMTIKMSITDISHEQSLGSWLELKEACQEFLSLMKLFLQNNINIKYGYLLIRNIQNLLSNYVIDSSLNSFIKTTVACDMDKNENNYNKVFIQNDSLNMSQEDTESGVSDRSHAASIRLIVYTLLKCLRQCISVMLTLSHDLSYDSIYMNISLLTRCCLDIWCTMEVSRCFISLALSQSNVGDCIRDWICQEDEERDQHSSALKGLKKRKLSFLSPSDKGPTRREGGEGSTHMSSRSPGSNDTVGLGPDNSSKRNVVKEATGTEIKRKQSSEARKGTNEKSRKGTRCIQLDTS